MQHRSNRFPRTVLPALLAALLLALGPLALRSDKPGREAWAGAPGDEMAIHDTVPWRLEADKITGRHDSEIVEASGNVVLSYGDDYLSADFARYFRATDWIFLRGNVNAMWRGDRLTAQEAEFNLKSRTGWLKRGTVFVAGPHLYFSGDMVKRHSGDSYSFTNAKVTACDGEVPAWSITAQQGDITIDGYAKLWSASFNVQDRPMLASPYFVLPAKVSRQSGLLRPQLGLSSRKGLTVNQPYYWAVDDESDATFFENFMSKRGLMQGLEYRHVGEGGAKGLWRMDWLHDQVAYKSENDAPDPLDEDELVRANRERWWLRGMYDGSLPDSKWKLKADLDMVSDQDYLREFRSGYSGYEAGRTAFLDQFGRTVADEDQNRTSALQLSRSWRKYGVAAKLGWTQSPEYGNGNAPRSEDASLQRLPQVAGYMYKDWLADGPLEWEAEAEAANFWRRKGTSGHRLDAYPRLSMPLASRYGAVMGSMGWRQSLYATTPEDDPDVAKRSSRSLPDLNLAAFTELFRVFDLGRGSLEASADNVGTSRWAKLKHSVQPRLEFEHRVAAGGSNRPEFDRVDRLGPASELTYSLSNVLSRRRETVMASAQGAPGQAPALAVDYMDFLRVRLEQGYDYKEATREEDLGTYPRRPFSDFLADATLKVAKDVSLVSKTWFSPYLGRFTQHEHSLHWNVNPNLTLTTGLDYQARLDEYKRRGREEINMLRLGVDMGLGQSWSASLGYRADLETARSLEKSLMLKYRHQCFGLGLGFVSDSLEDRIELMIELQGLNF